MPRPPDEPLYAFLHVPKSGGTTVENVLARRFGSRLQRLSARPGDRSWPRVADPACYSGHLLHDVLPLLRAHGDVRWVTWVREPFRSAISTYYYTRDVLTPQHPPGTLFVDRGLHTWLTHDQHGGWPLPPGYGHGRMNGVLETHGMSFDDFAFVGVTERFAESVLLMCRTFGWPPLLYRSLNPTRSHKTEDERAILADATVQATFRDRNRRDYELYDRAVARLDAQRAAAGPNFEHELARFERRIARHDRLWRLVNENPITNTARRLWRTAYDRRMRAAVARSAKRR